MQHTPNLNLVLALHCEAKPLIQHFRLKKIIQPLTPFPLFVNEEKNIHLIIGGVGKVKTAVATAFLQSFSNPGNHHCFLNLGIAGSMQLKVGDVLFANKIVDHATERAWYPFPSLLKNTLKETVITHDLPQTTYPAKGVVDMEASAFFQAAHFFVTQEHIHVLKVISDNSLSLQNQLTEKKVQELIHANLNTIGLCIEALLTLSGDALSRLSAPCTLHSFLKMWHFTQAETLQLTEFLRRWHIHLPKEDPLNFCKNEKKAAQVIDKIIKKLDYHANHLY